MRCLIRQLWIYYWAGKNIIYRCETLRIILLIHNMLCYNAIAGWCRIAAVRLLVARNPQATLTYRVRRNFENHVCYTLLLYSTWSSCYLFMCLNVSFFLLLLLLILIYNIIYYLYVILYCTSMFSFDHVYVIDYNTIMTIFDYITRSIDKTPFLGDLIFLVSVSL